MFPWFVVKFKNPTSALQMKKGVVFPVARKRTKSSQFRTSAHLFLLIVLIVYYLKLRFENSKTSSLAARSNLNQS